MDGSIMPGPEASPSRRHRFRPPAGLLGMLALIAVVESFIAGHGLEFRDPGDWAWAVVGKSARHDSPGRDILIFGDSLAKMAVAPALLQAGTGRSTFNLAVCAGQAPSSYFLFRRALEAGARPSAVFVDFCPRLLQLGPNTTPTWPAMLEPREALELAQVARDPDLFATIELGRIFPSFRARLGVRASLLAALGGRPNFWGADTPTYRRNWKTNLGAQIMPCGVNPDTNFVKIRQDFFSDLKFDRVNLVFMERFLELAESRSIPVYYLVTPLKPGLQAECERTGFDAAYEEFLKGVQSRHANIAMVDGRRASYDPAVFYDPLHLGREGAWAFSTAMVDVLRRHPPGHSGNRWIEFPKYTGLPAGSPPEDLNQSRAALAAEYSRVVR
jgi:hypothetical protein